MAIKINSESWAIKVNRRSFYKHPDGGVVTHDTKKSALSFAEILMKTTDVLAEPTRVKVRIEEME